MISGNIPDYYSPNYLRTINLGYDPQSGYNVFKRYQPTGPYFVTEYWPGTCSPFALINQTSEEFWADFSNSRDLVRN
jgi:hypothetical protein